MPSSSLIEAFTKATGVQGHDRARVVRRRAAEGFRRRQYRHRPGPVLGPLFAAAFVPAEMRRRHRRRRLSRQEVWRLGADGRDVRQGSGNKWIAIPICYYGNMLNYRFEALEESGILRNSRQRPTDSSNMPRQ